MNANYLGLYKYLWLDLCITKEYKSCYLVSLTAGLEYSRHFSLHTFLQPRQHSISNQDIVTIKTKKTRAVTEKAKGYQQEL